jgi:hypothetical protein
LQFACVVFFIRINKYKNGNKNSSGCEEEEEKISGNIKKIDWFDLMVPVGPRWVVLPSSQFSSPFFFFLNGCPG